MSNKMNPPEADSEMGFILLLTLSYFLEKSHPTSIFFTWLFKI